MRLIDADSLKEQMLAETPEHEKSVVDIFLEAVAAMIDEQPIIERKTGKWIRGKCDQCGAHAPFWPMASTYYESDYCPNCGVKMEDKQDGKNN